MAGVPQAKGLNIKYRELSPSVVQASYSLEHLEAGKPKSGQCSAVVGQFLNPQGYFTVVFFGGSSFLGLSFQRQ
jgi:hypothetical protein